MFEASSKMRPNKACYYTKRLVIKPLELSHAEKMFEPLDDDLIYKYIPDIRYSSVDDLRKRYKFLLTGPSSGNEVWLNWNIYLKVDAIPIGYIQLTLKPNAPAIIGYVISSKFWNLGYATEALLWALNYLREDTTCLTVEAYIDIGNLASIKLVERAGFSLLKSIKTENEVELVFSKQTHNI